MKKTITKIKNFAAAMIRTDRKVVSNNVKADFAGRFLGDIPCSYSILVKA